MNNVIYKIFISAEVKNVTYYVSISPSIFHDVVLN